MIVRGKKRVYSIKKDYTDWFVDVVHLAQSGLAVLPDGKSTTNDLGDWFDAWYAEYGDDWDVLDSVSEVTL